MNSKLTDLEAIFKTWAWQQYVNTSSWFFRLNYDSVTLDVKWGKIKIKSMEPTYKRTKVSDTSQVVFESKYENNTDDDQSNSFRAEKETISTAVIKLTKGFSKDVNVGIELPMPPSQTLPEAAKAVGSFGSRFYVDSEEGSSVETKLKWSVDTSIISRRRNITVAKLEVEETHVAYDFNMDVRLRGRVVVRISKTKDDSVVQTVEGDVATILLDMQDGWMSEQVKDVEIDLSKGVAVWPVVGTLTMKYGISQKVNISYVNPTSSRNKDQSGSRDKWPRY